ncbi:signal peptidase I [Coriobacterium glomerans PW2]|uniref:Signal peptidase I n=1 Tax=Coriobacterium glomerans (strain ATCC 49209 / DSM 20642 / JCM 10262 / PW2) TaxID=700015 RepID=F2N9F6_CORGP|nr:signal peptidase I [Coriobacterium glomerans]AEB06985.1 signal peptidase I [Coriobacterium glomerans PW2]
MASKRHSVLRSALEWITLLVAAFCLFVFTRTFVTEPFSVPTGSMEPTIKTGDQIFVQKLTKEFGIHVKRGDIVVFRNLDLASSHEILVKRVIATAGQTVDFKDGHVCVDGIELEEPYAKGVSAPLPNHAPGTSISFPLTVPDGQVWLMGDNRENSSDSRFFGPVPEDDLVGSVFIRYWPLSRFGMP